MSISIHLNGNKNMTIAVDELAKFHTFEPLNQYDQVLGAYAYDISTNINPTISVVFKNTDTDTILNDLTLINDVGNYEIIYTATGESSTVSTSRVIVVIDNAIGIHSVQFDTFNVDFDVLAFGDLSKNLTEGFSFKDIFYQEGFDFTDSSAVAEINMSVDLFNNPGLFKLNIPVVDPENELFNNDSRLVRYFTDVAGWPDVSFSDANVTINRINTFNIDQTVKKDVNRSMLKDVMGTTRLNHLFTNHKNMTNHIQDLDVSFNEQIREILGYITNAGFLTDADYGSYRKPESALFSNLKNIIVTSTSAGNKYTYNGVLQQTFTLIRDNTYVFEQSDSTNNNHPLAFSEYEDGNNGGGHNTNEYTTNVSISGSQTTITIDQNTPSTLYYYCKNHPGMGGIINIVDEEKTSHLFQNYAFTSNNFVSYSTGTNQEDISSGYHALQSSKFSAFNPLRILSSSILGEQDADEFDYYDISGKGLRNEVRRNILIDDLSGQVYDFWNNTVKKTRYFGYYADESYNVWMENNAEAQSVDASMVNGNIFSKYLDGTKVYIQKTINASGPDLVEEVVDKKYNFNFRSGDNLHLIIEYEPPFSEFKLVNPTAKLNNRKYEVIIHMV